jgi:hypothetical protein
MGHVPLLTNQQPFTKIDLELTIYLAMPKKMTGYPVTDFILQDIATIEEQEALTAFSRPDKG